LAKRPTKGIVALHCFHALANTTVCTAMLQYSSYCYCLLVQADAVMLPLVDQCIYHFWCYHHYQEVTASVQWCNSANEPWDYWKHKNCLSVAAADCCFVAATITVVITLLLWLLSLGTVLLSCCYCWMLDYGSEKCFITPDNLLTVVWQQLLQCCHHCVTTHRFLANCSIQQKTLFLFSRHTSVCWQDSHCHYHHWQHHHSMNQSQEPHHNNAIQLWVLRPC